MNFSPNYLGFFHTMLQVLLNFGDEVKFEQFENFLVSLSLLFSQICAIESKFCSLESLSFAITLQQMNHPVCITLSIL